MSRSILLVPCVALASACVYSNPTGAPAPLRENIESGITAHLLPSTSSEIVAFHIGEPAYVAVFALHRNSATLLYPQRMGQLAPLEAGVHRAFTNQAVVPFISRAIQRMAPHLSASPGPVTYLLVASEHPLDVAWLIYNRERLRRQMEFSLVGYGEQATISYLTDLVVPWGTPDGAWTIDVLYGWTTPAFSHSHSYATRQGWLLYAPAGCDLSGLVTGYGPWAGLQCFPRPPRVPQPPAETPPNDSTPEAPPKPDGEVRLGGMDAGSRITRPIVDPAVDTRRGARHAQPQPARDVRSDPSRERMPAVDRARERAPSADRSRERTQERSAEPRRARREASGESGQRAPRETPPKQDAARQSRAPTPQPAARRKQSPPPRPAESKAAAPDPRR